MNRMEHGDNTIGKAWVRAYNGDHFAEDRDTKYFNSGKLCGTRGIPA